jgi:hypothetical protein
VEVGARLRITCAGTSNSPRGRAGSSPCTAQVILRPALSSQLNPEPMAQAAFLTAGIAGFGRRSTSNRSTEPFTMGGRCNPDKWPGRTVAECIRCQAVKVTVP